ncbi:NADAR family protein (plasmid) [Paraburkholderia sprentiae WSM5005]|uniref:NADAR family protein n=1 Tax=Paraburkholderia sprentiae WSM5005 TaxID=754502 RepID=A0ACA8AXG3_9BURK|nr:NADAR family protein [Paraburkholderia sprentiae]APA90371.1 NADAR family protein [Paraburkholderia sprentiae WSM5005]
MRTIGRYTAFFGADDVLSNWHPCRFTYHGVSFSCVEQFMMYAKARLFGDDASPARILATHDPMTQKRVGRKVKNFDLDAWVARRESIVFVACREKFAQNRELRSVLLWTAPTVLVEASPYDRIWGVGLGERDPRLTDESQWRGQNLLGITLMKVRDVLTAH